ncbi:MAG: hypothetical protein KIT84_02465 [Labilithrix sp.]|nr:hypothetical protein [Labilithrix sp.]MCW5809849.1 hypothetical protein [Labilithrix sp.]
MKLLDLALVSATVLAISVAGCNDAADDDNDDTNDPTEELGTGEAALVADDAEAAETDADLEAALDEPLSGSTAADPGDPGDPAAAASDEELGEKVRTNAGRFFEPAGCLVSTRSGNAITHVFTGCTGPFGLAKLDGTVTSTYVRAAGKLTITHEAASFTVNGASVSGTRIIEYTRAGSVITKKRTGSWTGTTAKGKDIAHAANFVTSYDASSKCITRDGSAETSIGGRSFERTLDGYRRCGIGRGGCPEAGGKLVLSRTKSDETLSLTIELLGGVRYRVTRPNGTQVTRLLLCNPRAT